MIEEEVLNSLKDEIGEATWQDLSPHFKRDSIIVLDTSLELAETALLIATDKAQEFKELVERNLVAKPSEAQIKLWDQNKETKFNCVIVQPYVIVQIYSN